MNDQELIDEVRRLEAGTGSNQGIPYDQLSQKSFLFNKGFEYLLESWSNSSYSKKETWKWRQFVTMALEDPGKRAYMYRRTVSLLSDFGDSHKKYFILKTENGLYHVPNFESRLNRLKLLYRDYFKIYENILTRIHFDYPKEEQIGQIKGNINWMKTIQMSQTDFPLKFATSLSKKKFVTPENILLVLCAYWMLKESKKLIEFNFDEELSETSKKILYDVSKKSELILHTFPFNQVLEESKQFWNLPYDPPNVKIKQLELNTKERIAQGKIRNSNYAELLNWIEKFRDLSIKTIDNKSSTRNILQSLENIDTIYEIWIFMEFVSYLKHRGVLRNFELGDAPKCEFFHNGDVVTFWYDKAFSKNDVEVWAKPHTPDFIAMIDTDVLGVFDAKNYDESTGLGDTQNIILAYMNNFNTSFGALFYPKAPVNWDECNYVQKEGHLSKIVSEKNPDSSKGQRRGIRSKISSLCDCSWNELDAESKKILKNDHKGELTESTKGLLNNISKLVPRGFEEIKQIENVIGNNDFHNRQTLAYLRMSPEEDAFSIFAKNKTLEYLYDTIVKAIPLTVNPNFK